MHKPLRGSLSRWFVYLLGALAALACVGLAACTSRGTITLPGHGTQTAIQSPPGCEETMCDYFYARCADPCAECWESCGREDDQVSVIKCSQQCNTICAPSLAATPLSECVAELTE